MRLLQKVLDWQSVLPAPCAENRRAELRMLHACVVHHVAVGMVQRHGKWHQKPGLKICLSRVWRECSAHACVRYESVNGVQTSYGKAYLGESRSCVV
jgi:hypothetical protein